jgi:hypothetical protein
VPVDSYCAIAGAISYDTSAASAEIMAGLDDSGEAAKDYGDEAAKAHEKAIKAAQDEAAALAKVQAAWEDAQQAAAQAYAGKERDLDLMELEVKDPAAAQRRRDELDAQEMFGGTDELSAQNRARYVAAQEALRNQGGGGGGGASGGVGRISVSDPMNALRSLASDSMMRADDGSLMVNRKAADAASQLANLQERFNREAEIIQGGGFAQNTAGLRARRALELETKYQNKAMEVLRDVDPVLARDMLKSAGFTEAERAIAQEQAATGTAAAKADPAAATSDKLDKVIKLMTERLPIRVLAA